MIVSISVIIIMIIIKKQYWPEPQKLQAVWHPRYLPRQFQSEYLTLVMQKKKTHKSLKTDMLLQAETGKMFISSITLVL